MGDNKWLRNSFVYVIIMVAVLVLLFAFLGKSSTDTQSTVTQLAKDVQAGQVASIKLQADSSQVVIKYKTGHQPASAVTTIEQQASLSDQLEKYGVTPAQLVVSMSALSKRPPGVPGSARSALSYPRSS